jgi:SAM-dependent methyltransferase
MLSGARVAPAVPSDYGGFTMEPTSPNTEQIRYWNDTAGPKWVARGRLLDAQIAPLGRLAMDRAGLAAGERVLDVGCGCGETTVELAQRVGPGGAVTGIDVSAPMLAVARDRTHDLRNVGFTQADAQTHAWPPGAYDVVFSRFGVMFFADPAAAFGNLRLALRPGGRVAFVCWQPLVRNAWMLVPLQAAARHLPLPPPPAPDAPGPFAFGNPDRVRAILHDAGFADVAVDAADTTLALGGGVPLDDTVDLLLELGPTGALLREAEPGLRATVASAVREAVRPFARPDGVRMAGAVWIVGATSRG